MSFTTTERFHLDWRMCAKVNRHLQSKTTRPRSQPESYKHTETTEFACKWFLIFHEWTSDRYDDVDVPIPPLQCTHHYRWNVPRKRNAIHSLNPLVQDDDDNNDTNSPMMIPYVYMDTFPTTRTVWRPRAFPQNNGSCMVGRLVRPNWMCAACPIP